MAPKRVPKFSFREKISLSNESETEQEFDLLLKVQELFIQEQEASKVHGGSVVGRRTIDRERHAGHVRLYKDYFAPTPTYHEMYFRRRFRMSSKLFRRIHAAVEAHDSYFVQRPNAARIMGCSSLQKVTGAMKMLAYGSSADSIDDGLRMAESTIIESLRAFVKAVVEVFSDEYMRTPTAEDIARILDYNKKRGFPGMLGSIDCMHWKWKNCPKRRSGVFSGHMKEPTIILEAVATHDLWIWHSFFGLPGSCNDINVLNRSHVFDDLTHGRTPTINYEVNGHNYNMGYYLADGIYPKWATFVKALSAPQGQKNKYFVQSHHAARKDIERAFGVLQIQFAIIRNPSRFWDMSTMKLIMSACIIMHNMIVEDQGGVDNYDFDYDVAESSNATVPRDHTRDTTEFLEARYHIENRGMHLQLQADLIEHQWAHHGNE